MRLLSSSHTPSLQQFNRWAIFGSLGVYTNERFTQPNRQAVSIARATKASRSPTGIEMTTISFHRLCAIILTFASTVTAAEQVTLIENGTTRCSIVVGRDADFHEPDKFNWNPQDPLLQWAAEDLAHYLGELSGAKLTIGSQPVEGLIPIFVGCGSEATRFDPTTEFGDAYRTEASQSRIVLHGESRRAVYYAAAQLLHDLGVRWYAPGKLGEVVPTKKSIAIAVGLREAAPDFHTRRIWCHGAEQTRWMYRNRLGEPCIPSGHAAHAYVRTLPGYVKGIDGRAQHPEYYALVGDRPGRFNLANPEVVRHFAANVAKTLRTGPRQKPGGKVAVGSISVSPDGGQLEDERPEVRRLDGGRIDPILQTPSFSAAWFGFLTQVCAEMDRREPGLEFTLGSLSTLNYAQPPTETPLDPRILPVIAPTTFNRFTSIGTPDAPTSRELEEVLRGWTKLSPRVGVYLVNFIPGDMALPYTRRLHWTNDLPKLRSWGIRDVTIESHPNWHTMVPGNYVAAQLMWNSRVDVAVLLDEFYPNYFGPAAESMRRYDAALEQAYESARVFSGGVWGLHRVLTPAVMQELEQNLQVAEKAAAAMQPFRDRVAIVRTSLTFGKRWFAARDALNRFDFVEAEKQADGFLENYREGSTKFPLHFGPNEKFTANIERYFEQLHLRAFREAGRIARDGRMIYRFPDEWQGHLVPAENGAKPSLDLPGDLERLSWQPLKTFSATLDEQGHTFFRGAIWYRHEFDLPPTIDAATPLKLWFGGVDSRTRAFLNGTDLGENFVGGFGSLEIDVSQATRRGRKNLLLVGVDNTVPNAIGTGGLVRPVLIHAPRP